MPTIDSPIILILRSKNRISGSTTVYPFKIPYTDNRYLKYRMFKMKILYTIIPYYITGSFGSAQTGSSTNVNAYVYRALFTFKNLPIVDNYFTSTGVNDIAFVQYRQYGISGDYNVDIKSSLAKNCEFSDILILNPFDELIWCNFGGFDRENIFVLELRPYLFDNII